MPPLMPLSSLHARTQEGGGALPPVPETQAALSLLVVTREHADEKRYGLGRSIAPLLAELNKRHISHRYLCQADLDEQARTAIERWQRRLSRAAESLFKKTDWVPLLQAALERLAMGRLAARIAARDHYDLVHCHDPLIGAGLRLCGLAGLRRRRYAWGVTLHGFGSFFEAIRAHGIRLGPWLGPSLRRIESAVLRAADWVVAPTQLGITEVSRHLGIASAPANWHAVPHPRPGVTLHDRLEARAALGWASEDVYIVAIGRHDPVKDFPRLVEACAGLRTASRLHLVILGEGDYEALRRHAADTGFTHDLVLTVTDDVGVCLSAADIYVSTSTTEAFGIANLEALMAGVPAVCTAVGGVPEVVGDAAILVPPTDTAAIRQALQRLLDDEALRENLVRRGRSRAAAWPDVSQTADAYERIYRLAVAQKAG
jgi:glycosyltransferase involved in cell wall biosynthesis